MTAPSLTLPHGRCLSDVWEHLPHVARRRWLAVVAAEARAVAADARLYRGEPLRTVHEVIAREEANRAAAPARLEVLTRECATYRVGRPCLRSWRAAPGL